MVFGSVISSPRGSLSLHKALDLAKLYLDNALMSKDPEIILVLCHDTEVSLSQAKRAAKLTEDKSMYGTIAAIHVELGDLLSSQGHRDEAKAFRKKAEKWSWTVHSTRGVPLVGTSAVNQSSQRKRESGIVVPYNIFPTNIRLSANGFKPPEPDTRLNDTPQLACCLGLLQVDCELDDILDTTVRDWLGATKDEPDEKERLMTLATNVIRAFKRDEFKDANAIAEVVHLAPVLENNDFRYLIKEFYLGIDQSGLLDVHQLEGLAHLVQSARSGYLNADDLVKILGLLGTRLRDTHQQSTNHLYRLTKAVSHILNAMADTEVAGLDRENVLEPLSSYLDGLKGSSDPYLVYQAAYAYQALLYIPDNETLWQATLRRTGKVVRGMFGLMSAVKALDLNRFIEGLVYIQQGVTGASRIIRTVAITYDKVTSLMESGEQFFICLKEGLSFSRKCAWYPALRGADILIQNGQFAEFRKLICEVPCRRDVAFQWGVCERLGEITANSKWGSEIREGAIAFLGEIYRNDTAWGNQPMVKQWILNTLMQLSSQPGSGMQFATETLLRELQNDGDDKKQALCQICRRNGPASYPLKVALPAIGSPSLLDRVQEKPDVEGQIRQLRRQRLKEGGNNVYIEPQAKANLKTRDKMKFPLMDKVMDFLGSDQNVFLLLGESGSGKSTFTRELERYLWMLYKKGDAIPLHINLPTVDKPEHDIIAKQLRKTEFNEPQIRELKVHRKIILICDGYDESQQTHNLYTSNRLNQAEGWNAKMIVSCRSEYIGTDYRDRFQSGDRNHLPEPELFQEAVITPFSMDQIQEYIKKYVFVYRPLWKADDYKKALDLIPNLKELVTNPFLMSLALEVLPRMVDPDQDLSTTHITRVALYDLFIEHWLERGKKRLGEKKMGPMERAAFESLVDEGFTRNGIDFLKKLSAAIYEEQSGNPIIKYSRYNDEGSWKTEFFSREDEKKLLREACPLVRSGIQYRFIHRSLLEYGLSLAVFDPQDWKERIAPESAFVRRGSVSSLLSLDERKLEAAMSATSQREPNIKSPLARSNFTKEQSVVQFLGERVQQEPLFKTLLLDYIEKSKTDKKWCTAASNAITILVRSGMQFNGADLQGVRIPGADISNGMFDSAQLQGADLRHVDLRGTWLKRANMSDAEMTGVRLGEPPCLRHDRQVKRCLYSPDGKSIAVVLDNGRIYVYSTSTWEVLRTLDNYFGHRCESIMYSPKGNELAFCGNNTAHLWNPETGECRHILQGESDEATSIAYSPHGDRLATSKGSTVKIWNVRTRDCLHTLASHSSLICCIAFSPNSKQIATGNVRGVIRLWNIDTEECNLILVGHKDFVRNIAYSPPGDHVASIDGLGTVRLWNVVSGDCRLSPSTCGYSCPYRPLAYSPKGNQVARYVEEYGVASYADHYVQLWDVETGEQLHTLTGHAGSVTALVYSPQGDLIASSSEDRTIRIWDTETGVCLRTLTGHSDVVESIAFSPNGDRIVSGSADMVVRLWDVGIRTSRRYSNGHNLKVHMVKCSPKGDQVASCSDDMTARLWDVKTGSCQHVLRGHSKAVSCIEYSPQGDQIATGSLDKTIRLWNTGTGTCRLEFIGHDSEIRGIAYSPQGDRIASCGKHMSRLWETGSGKSLHIMRYSHSAFNDIVYSPNGSKVAIVGERIVHLWDTETGKWGVMGVSSGEIDSHQGDPAAYVRNGKTDFRDGGGVGLWDITTGEWHHNSTHYMYDVMCVAYSPSSNQIAIGSHGKIYLQSTETGKRHHILHGHSDTVRRIVYSAQGDLIVSASDDNFVCLWDAVSGQCRAAIQDFHDCVNDVAWVKTPKSNYIVASCDDGVVGMWKVIVDGDLYKVPLHWRTTNGELDVKHTILQDVQGLSPLSKRILLQSGALSGPVRFFRETSKGDNTTKNLQHQDARSAVEVFVRNILGYLPGLGSLRERKT